jgi:arylsulfatase
MLLTTGKCPLLAQSGHRQFQRKCPLLTQSGHSTDRCFRFTEPVAPKANTPDRLGRTDCKICRKARGSELTNKTDIVMTPSRKLWLGLIGSFVAALVASAPAVAQQQKPNIVVIMGDDIGMWNIGAYHRGMMAGRTPNLDKIAKEGMLFTDYYAEASCTAGRANFITGELPIRTGMTTVGQAGAATGIPAEAVTIATILKSMGYATGQFGKNHLGDKNEFLPTVHGFDEFFGYLYHLDAMEDPAHPNYPQNLLNVVGPRNMVHSWATDKDDPTEMPRWGKIGKQRIEDAGTLYPKRMETVDDEIRDFALKFIDKAKADGKPFFVWLNPTRMHIVTHLSPKYEAMRNSENGWSEEEAGMAQLDDDVGLVMKKLKDLGVDDNTIVVFTTDNGTEVFTWPDGGQTPFAQSKGTVLEGGFRVPALLRWPGHVPADSVQNGIFSGLDWLPTFVAAAGNPNITEELLKGKTIGDRTYKNHLDGYNQMAAITGKGPSARHEIFYLGESTVGAVRIDDYKFRFIDQPAGWVGEKTHPDVPYITNLRLDPFERTGWPNNGTKEGAQQYFDWFKYQFWRFVFVQQLMAKEIQTFLDFPPMQRGASFNLDALKAEMAKKMAQAEAASKGPSQ